MNTKILISNFYDEYKILCQIPEVLFPELIEKMIYKNDKEYIYFCLYDFNKLLENIKILNNTTYFNNSMLLNSNGIFNLKFLVALFLKEKIKEKLYEIDELEKKGLKKALNINAKLLNQQNDFYIMVEIEMSSDINEKKEKIIFSDFININIDTLNSSFPINFTFDFKDKEILEIFYKLNHFLNNKTEKFFNSIDAKEILMNSWLNNLLAKSILCSFLWDKKIKNFENIAEIKNKKIILEKDTNFNKIIFKNKIILKNKEKFTFFYEEIILDKTFYNDEKLVKQNLNHIKYTSKKERSQEEKATIYFIMLIFVILYGIFVLETSKNIPFLTAISVVIILKLVFEAIDFLEKENTKN